MAVTRICTTRQLPVERRAAADAHAVRTYAGNLPDGRSVDDLTAEEGDRLSVTVGRRWGTRVDLTVGFLDGPSRELRSRILAHMNAWGHDAAVQFHEVTTDPRVRISRFTDVERPSFGGYWSYVGTDVDQIPEAEPTMNLEGFTMATPESEFCRVVRHETGHTLGFPHEHMRQELVVRLDRDKVIAAYKASQGWTEQEVIDQILTPLEESSILGTPIDENSIMCYQIDGNLTIDGIPILGGSDINANDHDFAAQIYPG